MLFLHYLPPGACRSVSTYREALIDNDEDELLSMSFLFHGLELFLILKPKSKSLSFIISVLLAEKEEGQTTGFVELDLEQ